MACRRARVVADDSHGFGCPTLLPLCLNPTCMVSTTPGVSVWSDQISKVMLDSGELARRLEEDAVTGVTSNPTIFANAIVGSE